MTETEKITEFKCPSCGAPMTFNPKTQQLNCEFCGSTYSIEQYNKLSIDDSVSQPIGLTYETTNQSYSEDEKSELKEYVCNSCGGTITTDGTTTATHCPFCGNPVVLNNQVSGTLKPDLIIPFKLDKEQAKEAMRRHLEGKKLLPRVFTSENHIDEIKGIYVPFWLFDADVDAQMNYRCTRTRSYTQGDYRVTETNYYSVDRNGQLQFKEVPVDGSSKMPDDMMESIEPFDTSSAEPFSIAYLSGYYADKYDVSQAETFNRADERIQRSVDDRMRATTAGYESTTLMSRHITTENGSAKYALYPVWILNTSWKGQHYMFAMNGQTGKFVGDLPEDKALSRAMTLKYGGITAIIVFILVMLTGLL